MSPADLLHPTRTRVGFGTAPVAIEGRPDARTAVETIKAAIAAGAKLVDTADAYCISSPREHGYGERLVAKALREMGSDAVEVLVATKIGEWRPGNGTWQLRGRPEYLKNACEAGLRSLEVEAIGLLQLHRPDPTVPIEESVGAMNDLVRAGKAHAIGVCNVTNDELKAAMAVAQLSSVQNRMSFATGRTEVLDRCEAEGLIFIAHSPFGGPGGARRLLGSPTLANLAQRYNLTAHAAALSVLTSSSESLVAIPGTTRPERAAQNSGVQTVHLSQAELDEFRGDL